MKHLPLLCSLLGLGSLTSAQTGLVVPDDSATIQGAIDLLGDGDFVRVKPGTYHEALHYDGKALTVFSTGGAALTVIDATGLFAPVVSFDAGEGPGSVLRGFTLTGGTTSSPTGAGISAMIGVMASPTIQACRIVGNHTQAGAAGGVGGAPLLEDCLIEDNSSLYGAGGVFGAATLRRCVIRNNLGYDAGGLYLLDTGLAEDCQLVGNVSQEGARGAGATLSGASLLRRCVIARNTASVAGQYPAQGGAVFSPGPGPRLERCTIADNRVIDPYWFGDCGGIQGPMTLVDSIVTGNDGLQVGDPPLLGASYSNIEGGFPGTGNLALDPLFVDAVAGDYRLQPGSPCIDAGDPASPQDADCTRADMGALSFPQAGVFLENGSGVNPVLLTTITLPVPGTSWQLHLDSTPVAGASAAGLVVRDRARSPGLLIPAGEILVAGTKLHQQLVPVTSGGVDLSVPIPNTAALLGLEAHAQGLILGSTPRLTNALRAKVGH